MIEKGEDDFYSAFITDELPGFAPAGYGESVQQAKDDLLLAIDELREIARQEGKSFPDEIEVEYRYDLPSFFNCFDWINISAFARKVGINESKMRAYKSRKAFASEETINRILTSIKKLGRDMVATSL